MLGYFFSSNDQKTVKNNAPKKKSKFDDVEEAKYIDITSKDEKDK